MLDEVLKELKKNAQEMIIGVVIGQTLNQRKQLNQQKVERVIKNELASVQLQMNTIAEELRSTVKGRFGQKVQLTLNEQNEQLNRLS